MRTLRFPPTREALCLAALVIAAAGTAGCAGRGVAPSSLPATIQAAASARDAVPEPAPTATDGIFAADGHSGVAEINTKTGKTVTTFGSALGNTLDIAMDNAGNVYDLVRNGTVVSLDRLSVGGNTPTATYQPTSTEPFIVWGAPTGEIVVTGYDLNGSTVEDTVVDVWDAGSAGGAPSRTFKHSRPEQLLPYAINVGWQANGTLFIPYTSPKTHKQQYDVIPPGKSKPSRTIVDSLLGPSYFSINWMSVANDGTLYVAEWGYYTGDPFAGLYVYPPKARRRSYRTGRRRPADSTSTRPATCTSSTAARSSSRAGSPPTRPTYCRSTRRTPPRYCGRFRRA